MKEKKIKYNPKGLKRSDNVNVKTSSPKLDLKKDGFIIVEKDGYWKIGKK